MTQITKDNIAEVLKHNGIEEDNFYIDDRDILIGASTPEWCLVNFKNPNWVQIIEVHLGKKLELLPELHPFDFEQTLLDAGFEKHKYSDGVIEYYIGERGFSPLETYSNDNEYAIGSTSWEWKFKPTPQNARILIEIKQKFEELELA
ncbi:MAG: hypothetical protein EKK54_07970 [Neisseriaceae bacterium]|nr:MAG: hypothetical protein EKK54_07970 [Neisseriaceae bacterium]